MAGALPAAIWATLLERACSCMGAIFTVVEVVKEEERRREGERSVSIPCGGPLAADSVSVRELLELPRCTICEFQI